MAFKSDDDRRAYARAYYHAHKDHKQYWKYKSTPERLAYKRAWDRAAYDPLKQKIKNKLFRDSDPDRWKQFYVPVVTGQPGSKRYEAKLAGFKSGFERSFDANLRSRGIKVRYETLEVPYTLERTYHPDFEIVDHGFYIETKGLLDRDSKAKMRAVKAQHPDLDIRFVFMKADKRIPGTKQTHAQWAERNGFPWAETTAPEEWFE